MLVSYRPPRDLFQIQLQSIRDQTRRNFHCLIAADGDKGETRDLVAEAVGADSRFEVIGFSDNVGVYLNVERVLAPVPPDVGWIALGDQDDRWRPDKLDRLVTPPRRGQSRHGSGEGHELAEWSGAARAH